MIGIAYDYDYANENENDKMEDSTPRIASSSLRTIRLLAFAALAIASYLLFVSLQQRGHPLGCGMGSPCERVLSSKWSQWLGIPVSLPAVGAYLLILGVSLHPAKAWTWRVMMAAGAAVAGAAAWFLGVQAFVLGEFCVYCTADHLLGLALAGVIFFATPLVGRGRVKSAGVGAVLAAVFITGQIATAPRTLRVELSPGGQGRIAFDPSQFPTLGRLDAPHPLVSLSDYTCPHCRVMHGYLLQALKRYGDQTALVFMPVPLDASCNPHVEETEPLHHDACGLAKLALAVWYAKPDAFAEFDRWLFESANPRRLDDAHAKAVSLVGDAALQRSLADPRIDRVIHHAIELHQATRGPHGAYDRLPKVLSGGMILAGQPGTKEELFEALEEVLTLKPVGPAPR